VSQPGQANGGNVGTHYPVNPLANAALDANTQTAALSYFTGASVSASNSAIILGHLLFKGNTTGTVTLTPYATTAGTQYWKQTGSYTSNNVTQVYSANYFTHAGDTLGTSVNGGQGGLGGLPLLVVNITSTTPSGHAILALSVSTNATPTLYGSSVGTVTVTGSNHSYVPGYLTLGTATATGYATIAGYTPETDQELYAFNVEVNGVEANATQVNTLINEIEHGANPSTGIVAAANTWAGLQALATVGANPFNPAASPTGWNLYLDWGNAVDIGSGTATYLGFDLSNANDSNLVGYSIDAIAAVPEPMTLGLLAVGGIGLMARRHRKA